MKMRLFHLWDKLTSSYWFVPSLMLTGAFLLATAMLLLDEHVLRTAKTSRWLYAGGLEGARTLLSAVAGSVVTVASVVFSITIAALTQASSQFGPRLLRNFMRDTGNQVVLGTFVATFLYCILVLRAVPSGQEASVPHLSVTVAVVLAIASLCVLVYFIHHVSFSIQAPQVVARVWDELQGLLDRMYPEHLGRDGASPAGSEEQHEPPDPFGPDPGIVRAQKSGYLQAVDEEALMEAAVKQDLRLKIMQRPGEFVVGESVLVRVWPKTAADEKFCKAINEAFIVGRDRTPEQDIEFAINQMVEIAVRALSPGINDPFTAINCIDWLGEALCQIAAADAHSTYRYDERGEVRIVTRVSSFPGIVDAAFNQIRQYGRQSVPVTVRLLETITAVAEHLSDDVQRAALRRQAEIIYRQSRDALPEEEDRADVEERYQSAMRALCGGE